MHHKVRTRHTLTPAQVDDRSGSLHNQTNANAIQDRDATEDIRYICMYMYILFANYFLSW